MLLTTLYKNQKLFWSTLMVCHIALLAILYLKFGFTIVGESDKYLSEAGAMTDGEFKKATEYQLFYSAYIVYLAVFVKLKLPVLFIFISTWCLSAFASYRFYQLLLELINEPTAKLWITFTALSPLLQYWQLTLFSEVFFIAINFLFMYTLLSANLKFRLVKVILLGLILLFTRPVGIFSIVCFLALYAYVNKLICKKNTIRLGTLLILGLFLLVIFTVKLHYGGIASQIAAGAVYYGFPTWNSPALPPGDYTLADCYHFIIDQHGVGELLTLNAHKFFSFFKLTRIYYTGAHNFINALHYVFYILAFFGVYISTKKDTKFNPLFVCLCTIILLNAIIVALFFNEWSERYTLVIFPFLFLLSAYGISQLNSNLQKRAV